MNSAVFPVKNPQTRGAHILGRDLLAESSKMPPDPGSVVHGSGSGLGHPVQHLTLAAGWTSIAKSTPSHQDSIPGWSPLLSNPVLSVLCIEYHSWGTFSPVLI